VVGEIAWAVDTGRGWRYDETNGWVPAHTHVDTTPAGNLMVTYPNLAAFEVEGTLLELDDVAVTLFKYFISGNLGAMSFADLRAFNGDTNASGSYAGLAGGKKVAHYRASINPSLTRMVFRFAGLAQKACKISFYASAGAAFDSESDTPAQFFKADNTYDYSSASTEAGFDQLLTDFGSFSGTPVEAVLTGDTLELYGGAFILYRYEIAVPASWIASDGTLTVGALSWWDAENDATGADETESGIVSSDGGEGSVAYVRGYVEAT